VATQRIHSFGVAEARQRLQLAAAASSDMRPALSDVAREIEKRTDDAFRKQVSPAGERWSDLAHSTRVSRLRKRKGVWQKVTGTKKGERARVTDADQAASMLAKIEAVKLTPLVDTARARNSQHCDVTGPTSLQWSAVGYLLPHMSGEPDLPKRNPCVFELVVGRWALVSIVDDYLRKRLVQHVVIKGPA
jgi:hypothetical protein